MSIGHSKRCHRAGGGSAKAGMLSSGGLLDPSATMAVTPTATDWTVVALLIFAVILLALAAFVYFKGRMSDENSEQEEERDAPEGEAPQFVLTVDAEYILANPYDPRLAPLRMPRNVTYQGRLIRAICWWIDQAQPRIVRLMAADDAIRMYKSNLRKHRAGRTKSTCGEARATHADDRGSVEDRPHDPGVRGRKGMKPVNRQGDEYAGRP